MTDNNQTLGKRILIVEDEALIAEEMQDRLQRLGYQVAGIADTGPTAISIAEQTRPDLVLMDIQLKGEMDGIETAERIYRQLHIPVVYVTAHADHATLHRAKNIAQFGYILKPFQERELMASIPMALHRHSVEKLLQDSQITYATILASISDGVIVTDEHARLRFLNPVAEKLTGWRLSEAHGAAVESVLTLVDEVTQRTFENPLIQVLQTKSVATFSEACLLIDRNGRAIPIDYSAAPVIGTSGGLVGAVVVVRDINAQRAAERKFRGLLESAPDAWWSSMKAVKSYWSIRRQRKYSVIRVRSCSTSRSKNSCRPACGNNIPGIVKVMLPARGCGPWARAWSCMVYGRTVPNFRSR